MSERNYSSYSSQEEPRPRSRSRSSRPSEPRRGRKPGKRGRGRTVLWVIGTLLLVAVTTSALMCCFAAVYIRNTILPQAELDLSSITLNENSVMYYQDDGGQYQVLGQVLSDTSSQWVNDEEIPRYLVRQQVRPGCTGWAQVNGLRGDTDIAERIRYDIWYIENWTVALDIKIIFRTVFGGKMVNDEKLT